jgi:hypothetical protein
MGWDVELTDEFNEWFEGLDDDEQESVAYAVDLLAERGPNLSFPHSSGIERSRHGHMRELRIQHKGRPYRALYAFDPRRTAILLLGGDKTGAIAGTTCTFPRRMTSTTAISNKSRPKDSFATTDGESNIAARTKDHGGGDEDDERKDEEDQDAQVERRQSSHEA